MYKKIVSAMYSLNIVFGAIWTLAFPIGAAILASFLLTSYAGAPDYIYPILIILGALTGLVSMVRFVLSAMKALDRLEEEQKAKEMEKRKIQEQRAELKAPLDEDNNR